MLGEGGDNGETHAKKMRDKFYGEEGADGGENDMA